MKPKMAQRVVEKEATKLKRELLQAWKDIETLPITEIGARNAGVLEYMQHWEGRALRAEAQLKQAKAEAADEIERLRELARLQHKALVNRDPYAHRDITNEALAAYEEMHRRSGTSPHGR